MDIRIFAQQAKGASLKLATATAAAKNAALEALAAALNDARKDIEAANEADKADAKAAGLAPPLLKRLDFTGHKIDAAIDGVRSLVALPDRVGEVTAMTELDKGLVLSKVTCPIGVIGVIFESRPDALVQISSLCLKSGNAVLLKGGSEAARTNQILADVAKRATEAAGMPEGWIHLLVTRADVAEMLALDDLVDLIIPRGSNAFVRHIMENSRIPVMGHADGICHVYVDASADIPMALDIAEDSKCQYVAVCNAEETLLVHKDVAGAFLPELKRRLDKYPVDMRGCERTRAIIDCAPAADADWATEYLDYTLSIKIVDSADEAIGHINKFGSGHTDAIVASNAQTAEHFMDAVDSADVFWNASTRFADGFRFGFGAEVGISTSKLHARGPVGLDGLMIYKWKLRGSGQTVAPYAAGEKRFSHKPLTPGSEQSGQ